MVIPFLECHHLLFCRDGFFSFQLFILGLFLFFNDTEQAIFCTCVVKGHICLYTPCWRLFRKLVFRHGCSYYHHVVVILCCDQFFRWTGYSVVAFSGFAGVTAVPLCLEGPPHTVSGFFNSGIWRNYCSRFIWSLLFFRSFGFAFRLDWCLFHLHLARLPLVQLLVFSVRLFFMTVLVHVEVGSIIFLFYYFWLCIFLFRCLTDTLSSLGSSWIFVLGYEFWTLAVVLQERDSSAGLSDGWLSVLRPFSLVWINSPEAGSTESSLPALGGEARVSFPHFGSSLDFLLLFWVLNWYDLSG